MKVLVALMLMLSIHSAHAFDVNELVSTIKSSARPHLVRIFGEERVNQWFGSDVGVVSLPPIPEIKKDSRSTTVYETKEFEGTANFSAEEKQKYDYFFVTEVFEAVRRRAANANDISQWMNALSQGGTREGVYRGLVLDQTYQGLENYPMPINDSILAFASRFLEVYTGKKYESERLMAFNFFALKRSVTERALEIIDSFPNNDALADWYAVWSAEIAKDHGHVFKNKTRANIDPVVHQNWAKTYSTQYLKSEVVIKLHKIFNSLI